MPAPDITKVSLPIERWESWYAWRPKYINGKWYWREYVYRKQSFGPGGVHWKYGDIFDKLRAK